MSVIDTKAESANSAELELVLASGSPRRKALLESMGLTFSVLVTDTDESVCANEPPLAYVTRLAQDKARTAQRQLKHGYVILAADTIVCQGGDIFAKPRDQDDAIRIWQRLSNSHHQVITAVCLLANDRLETLLSTTEVYFGEISQTQMTRYWQTGEPLDKAGAYAIQGLASAWVQRIEGSYSNVVGLPLFEVNQLLASVDMHWI